MYAFITTTNLPSSKWKKISPRQAKFNSPFIRTIVLYETSNIYIFLLVCGKTKKRCSCTKERRGKKVKSSERKIWNPSVALGEKEISRTIFESNVKNSATRSSVAKEARGEGGVARSRCPFISSVRGSFVARSKCEARLRSLCGLRDRENEKARRVGPQQ